MASSHEHQQEQCSVFLPAPRPRCITPEPLDLTAAPRMHDATAQCLFFARLPAEVRREILASAFGRRRVHIDLRLRDDMYRVRLMPEVPWPWLKDAWVAQVGIMTEFGCRDAVCNLMRAFPISRLFSHPEVRAKTWVWEGFECHSDLAAAAVGRSEVTEPMRRYVHRDTCFECREDRRLGFWDPDLGKGRQHDLVCRKPHGKPPDECWLGAMGWLLACRQA